MASDRKLCFDRFCLDLASEQLSEGETTLALTPKAFAVLAHLARRPGQLASKHELLDAVWAERHVSDAVLKVAIREVRKALGDNARQPRYVETVHRKGYRFVAQVRDAESLADPSAQVAGSRTSRDSSVVGRTDASDQLHQWLAHALEGRRQVVFVSGEPGIGKTTLVEDFLASAPVAHDCWPTTGHCLEQFGTGEPYLPMLEALGRLSREPWRERLVRVLRRYAPTWLLQMPALQRPEDRAELERETLGATPERMLREMGEALEALSAEAPLVLVLEDLHWSDYATLDLIALLARRPEPARLLLIGTYRPADARGSQHPLHHVQRELESRSQCQSLRLQDLSETAVDQYLSQRFGEAAQLPGLAQAVHRHTDGNPLFMVSVVDYLEAEGRLVCKDGRWHLEGRIEDLQLRVPEGVRQLVQRQVDRLEDREQQMLAAASVIGAELSATVLADVLQADPIDVEEGCDRLVERRQFLRPAGTETLADGTVTARYSFIHSIFQQVLYQGLPEARRRRYHRRVGEGRERIFGTETRKLAAELAVHFEEARDVWRAVRYLKQAADTAVRRYANREAADYLTRALELADGRPPAELGQEYLDLLEHRARVLRAMGDMSGAATEFESLVRAARERGERSREVQALLYLASALYWVQRDRCLEIVDLAAERSTDLPDAAARVQTRGYCAHWNLNLRGWSANDAASFRQALTVARDSGDPALSSLYQVRDVYLRCWQSDYAGADRVAKEALQLALMAGDPFDYMVCEFFRVWALLHAGQWRGIGSRLQQAIEMAERNGHRLWEHLFRVELAWLHVEAFDPERAEELCAAAVERARQDPLETGQLLFKSLLVRGYARLAQGRVEDATQCFREILRFIDRGVAMDRILEMPLRDGLARSALATSDLATAQREAERLCALASGPGERTYLTLGRRTRIEVALATRQPSQALAWLEEALEELDVEQTPLAAWRLYATAAQCHRQAGHSAEADTFARRSRQVLERLASTLGPDDPLAASIRSQAMSERTPAYSS